MGRRTAVREHFQSNVFFLFSCSSEEPKKPATDAQGNWTNIGDKKQFVTFLAIPTLKLNLSFCKWILNWACLVCHVMYACACTTHYGIWYVSWHVSASSFQLYPPDAPQPRAVPSPRLAELCVPLPSLCVRPNLGWRTQLVRNLLNVAYNGSTCGLIIHKSDCADAEH